jgi:hypothetical protein
MYVYRLKLNNMTFHKIWGSHSGDYEEFYILGYKAV